jgi:hypothetical protein
MTIFSDMTKAKIFDGAGAHGERKMVLIADKPG